METVGEASGIVSLEYKGKFYPCTRMLPVTYENL